MKGHLMSVTTLAAEELTAMLSRMTYSMIGKGKAIHLSKAGTTMCGKSVDLYTVNPADYPAYDICKRCMVTAEKNYRMERKISYGVMRDQELDRMTYGGKPFTKAEENAAIEDAMQYAGRTTNANIAILTADGFVECTPEILESALNGLVTPKRACECCGTETEDFGAPEVLMCEPCEERHCEADGQCSSGDADWDPEIQVMRQLFPEYSDEQIREILDRPEFSYPNENDYEDADAFESGIRNANDTAREEGFAISSPEWLDCFQRSYESMHIENEDRRINAAFEAEQDAELTALDAEYDRQQHNPMDERHEEYLVTYPYMVGENLVYACCESEIGPVCEHLRDVSEEWHVFAMGEWHSMMYEGYAPICILIDGIYQDVDYRHHAGDCNNMCVLGDETPMEDTMNAPEMVEARLSIEVDGITVDLGFHTFEIPPLCEKSIATLYGEKYGEWKRPGIVEWDDVLTVTEQYAL
jgi:hypothetical protein